MSYNIPKVLVPLVFSFHISYAQGKDYLDYIVTKNNDTIYGAVVDHYFKTFLLQVNLNETDEDKKYIKHSIKDIKAYRFNDFITNIPDEEKSVDGIYESNTLKKAEDNTGITDYIVTKSNDTIYGKVYEKPFGAPYLIDKNNKKLKIKGPDIIFYSMGEHMYEYKKKEKTTMLDRKKAYLIILYRDKNIKLYGYRDQLGACYYIEKNNQLHFVNRENYVNKVSELFGDNETLIHYFNNNVYTYKNIYLITKYYANH